MLTRKAVAQSTEVKLRQTLQELKVSKESCNQLLREREESEMEIKSIIDRNSQLKSELGQLHIQHQDVLHRHDQLQGVISSFEQQYNTYERALDRITELEKDLSAANHQISQLIETQQQHEVEHTQSLYEELMASPGGISEKQLPPNNNKTCNLSKNKIKKYVKIHRFIRKTEKLIKKNKCFYKNIALRKERMSLIDSLEIYNSKLIESRQMHDRDTKQLQSDIQRLHESLDIMNKKYCTAQKEIEEHIRSATELVDLCQYNADRYDSLINNEMCNCEKSLSHKDNIPVNSNFTETGPTLACLETAHKNIDNVNQVLINKVSKVNKTIMFSDKLGQGLGLLIENESQSVTNICTPGQSMNGIVHSISQHALNNYTNIIVLCGDSTHTKKRDLIDSISTLLKLQTNTNCKLIISAFPYCTNLTWEENKRIYDLNLLLYNLICRHSDTILYFDINKFINNFVLTSDTMYLAKKYRTQIANLLAYNLQDAVISITKSQNNIIISSSTNALYTTISNKVSTSSLN